MARIALFVFALFASILLSIASPVPVIDAQLVDLERRITHVGRGTWFYPGLGNCGKVNNNNDLILAIGKGLYDRNGGGNCGQWVEIVNNSNGKKAYGLTRDSCQSCGDNDIDMSPALFQKLASLSTGQISVSWHFMNRSWQP
ncbi:expansin family protein [Flammula alnicola]|nr:expansin family protein [Flammula alnicola]